jgi:cell division protein FtsB
MANRAAFIRWDRVARIGLLLVLVVVIAMYINPLRTFFAAQGEAEQRRAEVAELQRENERLRDRKAQLRDPRQLEREARRLGMVKPGERAYVVNGIGR